MRIQHVDPPREFGVGRRGGRLRHVADIELGVDEVVTLKTVSGTELDITRKSWGYYGSPSLNGRLRDFGLRAALAMGVPRDGEETPRMYLMLVEEGEEGAFEDYLTTEMVRLVTWLDSDERVVEAARKLAGD